MDLSSPGHRLQKAVTSASHQNKRVHRASLWQWLIFLSWNDCCSQTFFFATLQPNAPHLIKQDYLGYILAWNEKTTFAFDEGERVLVVPFLRKSLLKALWSSPKGIDRDAMRFQALDAILGCLTSYVAQIASISCANVFLAALSWRHRFFCAISTIQKTFCWDRTHFTNLWFWNKLQILGRA